MTLCLNSVFNDDEKTIAFRAHKNIFYLIVNKKRKKKCELNTKCQRWSTGIFRCRKLENSFLCSMENPFRFDGSLNICCFSRFFSFNVLFCFKKDLKRLRYVRGCYFLYEYLSLLFASGKDTIKKPFPSRTVDTQRRLLKSFSAAHRRQTAGMAVMPFSRNVLLIFSSPSCAYGKH